MDFHYNLTNGTLWNLGWNSFGYNTTGTLAIMYISGTIYSLATDTIILSLVDD